MYPEVISEARVARMCVKRSRTRWVMKRREEGDLVWTAVQNTNNATRGVKKKILTGDIQIY